MMKFAFFKNSLYLSIYNTRLNNIRVKIMSTPITVAYGDGIGPEIMEATLGILKEAKAPIRIETIEVGEKLYLKNYTSGISPEAWSSLERTKILLKAPITTPLGGGYKSLNVTMRKKLGLFANVRPSIAYHPFVSTYFPKQDLVIIRENEEDLYAGIEYRQTSNNYESLKIISKTGCEKIIRYAFEYAVSNNRKKVTCLSKDNIMKFTDGIFHKVFNEISKDYPNIATDHFIIDIGTAHVASKPQIFDVIVTSNLYGDIISDVAAEVCGSVGMSGSSNIGQNHALFEAIHGSAPDIAGKNIANPSGLINAAVMMLVHIGANDIANLIENAWKKTIEDGIHTADIYSPTYSTQKVGTKEFAAAVISNFGNLPNTLKQANYTSNASSLDKKLFTYKVAHEDKTLVGVDVYLNINEEYAGVVVDKLNLKSFSGKLKLSTISVRGLKLWPSEVDQKVLSDHWCARFIADDASHTDILELLNYLKQANIDFVSLYNLYEYNKVRGYSLAQGE